MRINKVYRNEYNLLCVRTYILMNFVSCLSPTFHRLDVNKNIYTVVINERYNLVSETLWKSCKIDNTWSKLSFK